MAHNIEAIIGRAEALGAFCAHWPEAVLVPLPHGLAMVPATDRLRAALNAGSQSSGAAGVVVGFDLLGGGLATALPELSRSNPIAYVETRYFGGDGTQAAALYRAGRLEWRSEVKEDSIGPISRALRALGVRRGTAYDEFDAVGLGNFRSTEDWERQGTSVAAPG